MKGTQKNEKAGLKLNIGEWVPEKKAGSNAEIGEVGVTAGCSGRWENNRNLGLAQIQMGCSWRGSKRISFIFIMFFCVLRRHENRDVWMVFWLYVYGCNPRTSVCMCFGCSGLDLLIVFPFFFLNPFLWCATVWTILSI